MYALYENRTEGDRRQIDLTSRSGVDRRLNAQRRSAGMDEADEMPDPLWDATEAYWEKPIKIRPKKLRGIRERDS